MKSKFTEMSLSDQAKSKTVKFYVDKENRIVVCRLYDRWYDIYHTGKTHCHDVDKFDEMVGRAIAFNKARQKELEHNLKMIENEKRAAEELYNKTLAKLDKRAHINVVYLTGVRDELAELMN